jgi:hypothetical protein
MAFLPTTQYNTEQLLIKVALLLEQLAEQSINHGYFLPAQNDGVGQLPIPPANSIFYNTTTSKLQYRDSSNVDHDLY